MKKIAVFEVLSNVLIRAEFEIHQDNFSFAELNVGKFVILLHVLYIFLAIVFNSLANYD